MSIWPRSDGDFYDGTLITSDAGESLTTVGDCAIQATVGGIGVQGDSVFKSDIAVDGNVTIGGDVNINGAATVINTTTLEITDKNIVLADGATLDSQADGGGITLTGATNKTLTWTDATDTWDTNQGFRAAGIVTCQSTQGSTSSTTGSLVVAGGVGVAGQIHSAGDVYVETSFPGLVLKDTNASSAIVNSLGGFISWEYSDSTRGGFFGQASSVDPHLWMANETPAGNIAFYTTPAAAALGAESLVLTIGSEGVVEIATTTQSTATSNGALVVDGGVGIAKNLNVGGDLAISTSTPASASATGTTGTITYDSSYIYVCVATDTWERVAIATW